METNVFMDKSIQPDDRRLAHVLGEKATFWETIKQHIAQKHGEVTEEWKFYNTKSGWTLKVLLKKRNLFFFTPLSGYFRLAFVFGDKAVSAVEKSDLPEALKNELKNARKYAEGRGIRIEVKSRKDVEHVKKLIDIKVGN
jgi:signal transduction histidine kinase